MAQAPENAYGFTAQQIALQAAKYDKVKAKNVVGWINAVVGQNTITVDGSDPAALREQLQDGVALCKLINILRANTITQKVLNANARMAVMKVNQDNERISKFTQGVATFTGRSVPFEAQDLRPTADGDASKVNMTAVIDGIFGLGVYCHQKNSNGSAGGIKPIANTGNKME